MKVLVSLFRMVVHPRVTSRELREERTVRLSLTVVLSLGIIYSIMFLISHFARDYPPPPDVLKIWVETWGEFAMLPLVKIPAESYRLAQAIFIIPLVLAIWILMAGSARLLSVLFGGKVTYDQYLNLFGFSFFSFWIIAQLFDTTYSSLLGSYTLSALRMEYGPVAKTVSAGFPEVVWPVALSFGGLYNAIGTHELERFPIWKVAVIGVVTAFWPIVLITLLLR